MLAVQIGPLAFPTGPLLWGLGCIAGGLLAGRWVRTRAGEDAGRAAADAFWQAVLMGFAAARLAFVLSAWAAYAEAPWRVLDLRDGGWQPAVGVLAAAAWLAWRASRQRVWALPLAAGGLGAVAIWAGGSTALGLHRTLPVPAVALQTLDGQQTTLPALTAGRPAVINLWASWCGPCRAEMPILAAARAEHPDVQFVFLNQGEAEAVVRRYLHAERLPLHDAVWLDPRSAAGPAVASTGLPTTLFVDADGRIVHRHFGLISAPALRVRLAAL